MEITSLRWPFVPLVCSRKLLSSVAMVGSAYADAGAEKAEGWPSTTVFHLSVPPAPGCEKHVMRVEAVVTAQRPR